MAKKKAKKKRVVSTAAKAQMKKRMNQLKKAPKTSASLVHGVLGAIAQVIADTTPEFYHSEWDWGYNGTDDVVAPTVSLKFQKGYNALGDRTEMRAILFMDHSEFDYECTCPSNMIARQKDLEGDYGAAAADEWKKALVSYTDKRTALRSYLESRWDEILGMKLRSRKAAVIDGNTRCWAKACKGGESILADLRFAIPKNMTNALRVSNSFNVNTSWGWNYPSLSSTSTEIYEELEFRAEDYDDVSKPTMHEAAEGLRRIDDILGALSVLIHGENVLIEEEDEDAEDVRRTGHSSETEGHVSDSTESALTAI